jgi:plasmid stabilization system protein ParE
MVALATTPGAGHRRPDLTALDVRFFPFYSYLIVYRETAGTLQIVAILHAARDVPRILDERL